MRPATQMAAKSRASRSRRSVRQDSKLRSTVALTSIPVKTPKGQAELTQRTRQLNQRQRTMLFLVDGKRGVVEVQAMALQAGVQPSCLDELLALGLVLITQPTVPMTRFTSSMPKFIDPPEIALESDSAPSPPVQDARVRQLPSHPPVPDPPKP